MPTKRSKNSGKNEVRTRFLTTELIHLTKAYAVPSAVSTKKREHRALVSLQLRDGGFRSAPETTASTVRQLRTTTPRYAGCATETCDRHCYIGDVFVPIREADTYGPVETLSLLQSQKFSASASHFLTLNTFAKAHRAYNA